jgi:hypothetical protein
VDNPSKDIFEGFSASLVALSAKLTDDALALQKRFAKLLAKNPSNAGRLRRQFQTDFQKLVEPYIIESKKIVGQQLPKAYVRGLQLTDDNLKGVTKALSTVNTKQFFATGAGTTFPSETAIKLLEKYPQHLTMYSVFQAAAEETIGATKLPIIRSMDDAFRQLTIQTGTVQYLEANELTRLKMSQRLVNTFSDRGLTGIIYSDGRRVSLEGYSEMVARTQTANANRQAAMNRQSQYGFDLVRISSHSPCSDLCFDHQGEIFSLSGASEKYPSLDSAIAGGLYHPNCKHSQSAYIEGVTGALSNPGTFASNEDRNDAAYRNEQRQRQIERNIRHWKKRKSVALSPDEAKKAQTKISSWQKQQRELVGRHSYLNRSYQREN